MPVGLLSIEDLELEKVSGGLMIEENSDGSVSRVIASKEEYGYISALGYQRGQELTAEDVEVIRSRFDWFGFRVRSHRMLMSKKSLPEKKSLPKSNRNKGCAELIVID